MLYVLLLLALVLWFIQSSIGLSLVELIGDHYFCPEASRWAKKQNGKKTSKPTAMRDGSIAK